MFVKRSHSEGNFMTEQAFLNLREAAALLRLSRSRLYELANTGKVPCFQLEGRGKILFRTAELEAALTRKAIKQ